MPDSAASSPPIAQDTLCPNCGYCLFGLSECRCPECGREFDPHTVALCRIPWERRSNRGRFVSFWKTVWMATVRPQTLGAEARRPVDDAAARRFRIVAMILGAAALAGGGATLQWSDRLDCRTHVLTGISKALDITQYSTLETVSLPWLAAQKYLVFLPAAVLCLWMLAGVWGILARSKPRNASQSATTISRYACASLVWLWVPVALGVIADALYDNPRLMRMGCRDLPGGIAGAVGLLWTIVALYGGVAMVTAARGQTLGWALRKLPWVLFLMIACILYCLIVLPWVVGLLWLMVQSLA